MLEFTCPQMQQWFRNLWEHPGTLKPDEEEYFCGAYHENGRLFSVYHSLNKLKVAQQISRWRNDYNCHKIVIERPNRGMRVHERLSSKKWLKEDIVFKDDYEKSKAVIV